MPQASANKEYKDFSNGLITEATPIGSPEAAAKDLDNFDLNRDGSMSRRLGIDYEANFSLVNTGLTESEYNRRAKTTFMWEGANQNSDIQILVVQVGNQLWFLDASGTSISSTVFNAGAALTLDSEDTVEYQYSIISGVLVITTSSQFIRYLKYDVDTDVVTEEKAAVLVRDIWGLQDDLDVNERPGTLSDTHNYNLLNQGWTSSQINSFKNSAGVYPSNSDNVNTGIDDADDKKFNPKLITRENFGTTPSAKGKIILDIFERSATRAAGGFEVDDGLVADGTEPTSLGTRSPLSNWRVPSVWGGGFSGVIGSLSLGSILEGIPTDRTLGGVSSTAAFAGRVFYSGFGNELIGGDTESPLLANYVAFSQVVDNIADLGRCYSEADFTSNIDSSVAASDGGTIKITGSGKIHAMVPLGRALIVFAENGLWSISGSNEGVFSADEFQVAPITSVGVASASSIVKVENNILYWSTGGIYQVSVNEQSFELAAASISEATIQGLWRDIGTVPASCAKVAYDPATRKVLWVFSSDESNCTKYDRELVLDVALGAWSKSSFPSTSYPWVSGLVRGLDFVTNNQTENVVDSGVLVEHLGTQVVHTSKTRVSGTTGVRYVAAVLDTTVKFTVALKKDTDFLDWKTFDTIGIDASGFYRSWEDILDDTQRNKQAKYLTMNMKLTETGVTSADGIGVDLVNPSSCLATSYWDYASTAASGKVSAQFEVYRLHRMYWPETIFDYGHEVMVSKSKLRGRGKALSMQFDTSPGKDCIIYGWAIAYLGATDV